MPDLSAYSKPPLFASTTMPARCSDRRRGEALVPAVHTGGVPKTDDNGRTWNLIFDSTATGSIGDIGVSWSNPEVN